MNRIGQLLAAGIFGLLLVGSVARTYGYDSGEVYYEEPSGAGYGDPGDRYVERAPDPYSDERVSVFFDDLSPYGDWMYFHDLGWAWRPGGVPRHWRPYTDGQWVWTDDGWTWLSDWEWGWAPFHYGRWLYTDDAGWVWVPDLEWAPAWVVWRHGDGWVGWAPLPPRVYDYREVLVEPYAVEQQVILPPSAYCFVEERVLLEPGIGHYVVPPYRNASLVHATRNITHYSFAGGRAVNRSLEVQEVERFTRRPVKQYRIIDRDRPVKGVERVKNDEVVMFRPSFPGAKGPRERLEGGVRRSGGDFVIGPRVHTSQPPKAEAGKGGPVGFPPRTLSSPTRDSHGNVSPENALRAPGWQGHPLPTEALPQSREARTPAQPGVVYPWPGRKEGAVSAPQIRRYSAPGVFGTQQPSGPYQQAPVMEPSGARKSLPYEQRHVQSGTGAWGQVPGGFGHDGRSGQQTPASAAALPVEHGAASFHSGTQTPQKPVSRSGPSRPSKTAGQPQNQQTSGQIKHNLPLVPQDYRQ
jgi:hypothetical protein